MRRRLHIVRGIACGVLGWLNICVGDLTGVLIGIALLVFAWLEIHDWRV